MSCRSWMSMLTPTTMQTLGAEQCCPSSTGEQQQQLCRILHSQQQQPLPPHVAANGLGPAALLIVWGLLVQPMTVDTAPAVDWRSMP
jgi:hypothetical protein